MAQYGLRRRTKLDGNSDANEPPSAAPLSESTCEGRSEAQGLLCHPRPERRAGHCTLYRLHQELAVSLRGI
jgi:hypothetical protein